MGGGWYKELSESELGASHWLYLIPLSSFCSFLCCNNNTLRVFNLLYLEYISFRLIYLLIHFFVAQLNILFMLEQNPQNFLKNKVFHQQYSLVCQPVKKNVSGFSKYNGTANNNLKFLSSPFMSLLLVSRVWGDPIYANKEPLCLW